MGDITAQKVGLNGGFGLTCRGGWGRNRASDFQCRINARISRDIIRGSLKIPDFTPPATPSIVYLDTLQSAFLGKSFT